MSRTSAIPVWKRGVVNDRPRSGYFKESLEAPTDCCDQRLTSVCLDICVFVWILVCSVDCLFAYSFAPLHTLSA